MLYCERCSALFEENSVCPLCHRQQGREPKDDDLCYLTDQGSVWSDVVADVLRQRGVPAMRKLSVGVAPFVGSNLARYRFYVPYPRVEEARSVLRELLTPAQEERAED